MQAVWTQRGQLYSACGGKPPKRDKKACESIKIGIKRWISKQENLYKSGDPSCAGSALMPGAKDGNLTAKPKKAKKAKKKTNPYTRKSRSSGGSWKRKKSNRKRKYRKRTNRRR